MPHFAAVPHFAGEWYIKLASFFGGKSTPCVTKPLSSEQEVRLANIYLSKLTTYTHKEEKGLIP